MYFRAVMRRVVTFEGQRVVKSGYSSDRADMDKKIGNKGRRM